MTHPDETADSQLGKLQRYRDDGPLSFVAARMSPPPIPAWLLVVIGLAAPFAVALSDLDVSVLALAVGWAVLVAGWSIASTHENYLDWLVVPLLRAGEYSVIATVGLRAGVEPAVVFALLCAIAFHQYDVVYRLRHRLPVPRWLEIVGLGWAGRLIVVAVAAPSEHLAHVYVVMMALLWAVYVVECVATWTFARPAVAP